MSACVTSAEETGGGCTKAGCSAFPGTGCHGNSGRRCEARLAVSKLFVEVNSVKSGRLASAKVEVVVF